ncbi:MAG: hypothetical protein KBD10_01875 [Candidatus Pacebacteria bacterium]|nr:hypothetical protein [Candidatus Paceibacterota bacterium]
MENENQNFEIKSKSSGDRVGPLVGSTIIILIIVLGAFYLFSTIKEKVAVENQNAVESEVVNENKSDEIIDIESDLNSTEVLDMEAELKSMEADFQI